MRFRGTEASSRAREAGFSAKRASLRGRRLRLERNAGVWPRFAQRTRIPPATDPQRAHAAARNCPSGGRTAGRVADSDAGPARRWGVRNRSSNESRTDGPCRSARSRRARPRARRGAHRAERNAVMSKSKATPETVRVDLEQHRGANHLPVADKDRAATTAVPERARSRRARRDDLSTRRARERHRRSGCRSTLPRPARRSLKRATREPRSASDGRPCSGWKTTCFSSGQPLLIRRLPSTRRFAGS